MGRFQQNSYHFSKCSSGVNFLGAWSKKHLTSANGSHPKNSHLRNTSRSDNYSVETYNDYVPEQVLSAENRYTTLYYNKYKPNNQNLTMGMIQVIYINFKCDLLMDEEDQITYHLNDVHGIAGITALKPVQLIKIDASQEFKLPDLMDIELSGPDQRGLQVNSIFTRSVKSGVITKTNNKKTADLMEDQSQVFMTELGKSTPIKFFSRFEMFLRMALEGEDVRGDFTCKWWKIENSLFKAISKEQNTIRYAQFLEKDYTQFHSLPMEILINSVDAHVDGVLGKSMKVFKDAKKRTLCNYIYSIKKKHELIFDIARHLGDDFKVIRQYISEKCTSMQDDIEKILDISDLQEDFKTVFENKGVLTQYTSENVPAPRKGTMGVNETKIKNDGKKLNPDERPVPTKEQIKEINSKFLKKQIDAEEDKKIKTKVVELALKLADNPANTKLKVYKHKDILELLKTLKARVCWCPM